MRFIDYYQVMGVAENASADEVKKAYRRLARKYHPDVSKEKDAENKFKELGEAYEVLKDSTKRAAYDELRRDGAGRSDDFTPPPGWARGRTGSASGHGPHHARQFSDFFEAIFGREHAADGGGFTMAGGDVHHRLSITLEEAQHGATRTLTLQMDERNAQGVPVAPKILKVTVPKGIRAGQEIRLKGQGHPGLNGAPNGDLYLEIVFAPHRLFTIEGRDLSLVLPVAPWELVLGGVVTAPTLDGAVKLTIPPNSKALQKLRISGKGLSGDPPGDLYVILQVVVPTVSTDHDRELFRALADGLQFNPRAALEV
ncbi:MAG: DnaJ domain-containing protein [Gammaproteobacteria bacterium]|nr:DnaJ domain-containing protein [Gammaproteobacteria bacterium]